MIVTWQISFEHIRRERPSAADRLSLMCFYDHRSIPDSLLRIEPQATSLHQSDSPDGLNRGIQQLDLEDDPVLDQNLQGDLRTLLGFHLVSIGPNHSTYEMHSLVQLAVQKWLESHDRREMWLGFAIRILDREFPDFDFFAPRQPICQAMQPHANLLSQSKPHTQDVMLCWASMLYKLAAFELKWGSAVVGEDFAMNSASARECILGKDHKKSLDSMTLRASLIRAQGRYNDAEGLIGRTLKIRAATFGFDHHDTLDDNNHLLGALLDAQKYEAAEGLGHDLMQLCEKHLGATSNITLDAHQQYAVALDGLGKHREAEELYRQVLAVQMKEYGESDIASLTTAQNLATTLRKLGHLDEAIKIDRRVLEAQKESFGFEHESTLTAAHNLAVDIHLKGNMSEAEQLMQRVVKGAKRTIGEQHPGTLTFLYWLACIKQDMGLYEGALDLIIPCVKISKQVWDVDHHETTRAIELMEEAKSALERERNEDQVREHKRSKKRKGRRKAHKPTSKRTEKPNCVVQ